MKKKKIPTAYDQRPDATGPIIVTLPILPPSVNALYKNVAGKGRAKTAEYDAWLAKMGLLLRNQCKERMPIRSSVVLLIEDKHPQRDADNCLKGSIDLLVKVGILAADSAKHVRSVSATWAPDIEGMSIQVWPAIVGAV